MQAGSSCSKLAMKSREGKTAKACEPCRRRKTKCNGNFPCASCEGEPDECVYRLKARIRQRRLQRSSQMRSSTSSQQHHTSSRAQPPSCSVIDDGTHTGVDTAALPKGPVDSHDNLQSAVTESDSVVATDFDRSRVFYGRFSNHAFAHRLRKMIMNPSSQRSSRDRQAAQDCSNVLDMFMQRHLFFDHPPRPVSVDVGTPMSSTGRGIQDVLSKPTASRLLEHFEIATLNILPFFSHTQLTEALDKTFDQITPQSGLSSEWRALLIIILAIGALSEADSQLAETLYMLAKQEACRHEDTVTLETIQYSLLAADYQVNMGRGTSGYLHVGAACRKAFAMGLTATETNNMDPKKHVDDEEQRRLVTLWCLYYFDSWYSIMGGRKRMLRGADIDGSYRSSNILLAKLCHLAAFLEEIVESVYDDKSKSLRELYTASEHIYYRMRKWAESVGIGCMAASRDKSPSEIMAALTIHNAYFQVVQIMFRPFIAAQCAQAQDGLDMWLRQACRTATDAAIDGTSFVNTIFQVIDTNHLRRRDAYFLEISCSLLLFESLLHPSKHPHNRIYIQFALQNLKMMPQDVPVTTIRYSIQSIAEAVEKSVESAQATAVQQLPRLSNPIVDNDTGISPSNESSSPSYDTIYTESIALDPYASLPFPGTREGLIPLTQDLNSLSFLSSLSQVDVNALISEPFGYHPAR